METTELFYPEINVGLGSYTFTEGIEIEVYSNKDSYYDWAKVRFTQEFQEKISIAAKEKAFMQLGYNDVFDDVFEGYVTKPYNGGISMNEILLKDEMILLEEATITSTFLETSPQEILYFCLAKAGVQYQNIQLSKTSYPEKARVPIYQKNVIAVINEIHSMGNCRKVLFFRRCILLGCEAGANENILL